jgi:hypothetical protein
MDASRAVRAASSEVRALCVDSEALVPGGAESKQARKPDPVEAGER